MPNSDRIQGIFHPLVDLLGPDAISKDPSELASFAVNGSLPCLVAMPTALDQIAAVVRLATEAGLPVIPWGTGTKQELGGYRPPEGIVLGLSRFRQILELDEGNQTVSCEAGIRLADLDAELRRKRLWLPLDPEDYDDATVGGTLATNTSGPRRLRYRTARDYLLGIKVVTAKGEVVQIGHKAIKDVAGYDLRKLMIGSWGTLGIIAEMTLRLMPAPEASATLIYQFPDLERAGRFTANVLKSQLTPSAIELLDRPASNVFAKEAGLSRWFSNEEGSLILLQVEGLVEEVEQQIPELNSLARQEGANSLETAGLSESTIWAVRRRLDTALRDNFPAAIRLKASVPLDSVVFSISSARESAFQHGLALSTVSHAGNGIIYFYFQTPSGTASSETLTLLREIRARAAAVGGFSIMEYGPNEIREALGTANRRTDFRLMRSIKSALDPVGVLNPGRLAWLGI